MVEKYIALKDFPDYCKKEEELRIEIRNKKYHTLHDHFKTLLLFILVVYAAINYYEKHVADVPTNQYNQTIDNYKTYKTYDAITNYLNNQIESQRYFDDSHPII